MNTTRLLRIAAGSVVISVGGGLALLFLISIPSYAELSEGLIDGSSSLTTELFGITLNGWNALLIPAAIHLFLTVAFIAGGILILRARGQKDET